MDGRQRTEGEENDTTTPLAGLGYGGDFFWIGGLRVSTDDCPECLEYDEYDCSLCEFFAPSTCPLRHQRFYITNIRTILDLYRQRRTVPRRHRQELIQAIGSELRAHGRPLHYVVLARMVADRYPTLMVSEQGVLRIMASRPDTFEKVTKGVYRLRRTNEI